MQENSFEQKVQLKMEELMLPPSGHVWDKVNAQINKEKKRRRIFIWFFFFGILALGGGAWWGLNNKTEKSLINIPVVKTNTQKETITENGNEINKTLPDNKIKDQNLPAGDETQSINKQENNKTDQASNKKSNQFVRPERASGENAVYQVQHAGTGRNKKTKSSSPAVELSAKNPEIKKDEDKIQPPAETEKDRLVVMQEKNTDIQKPVIAKEEITVTDSNQLKKEEAVIESRQKEENTIPPAAELKPAAKKKTELRKWQWGIDITPGISFFNDKLLSIGGPASADFISFPSGGSGTGGPVARKPPSESKPGLAFKAGVFVKRKLSPVLSFSAGINYGFYSDHIRIGARNTQSNLALQDYSAIYFAGSGSSFINKYHFLELPAELGIRINKNQSRPFSLNLGFTAGRMIATNALVYDSLSGGLYYNNKDRFNKTQVSFSTGLEWTMPAGKRMQWSFGPALHVHLNRIVDNPLDKNKYLFFTGIRTRLVFKNDKK